MFWRLGKGRTQLSKPRWLQKPGRREQIGTEERRSENIYGRKGGTKVSNDHSTLHVEWSPFYYYSRNTESPTSVCSLCLVTIMTVNPCGHQILFNSDGKVLMCTLPLKRQISHLGIGLTFIQIPPLFPFHILPFRGWISELLFRGMSDLSPGEKL